MTSGAWGVSERLEAALAAWLDAFERSQGDIGYPIYPSVMWSLGGAVERRGETELDLPAGYGAGFYRREPRPRGDRLLFVPSRRFGLVVFLPRDEDAASDRRLIDYDGATIVVR